MYLIFDLDDTLLDTSATAGRFKLQEVARLWDQMNVLKESPEQAAKKMIEERSRFSTAREVLRKYAREQGFSKEALAAGEREYYENHHEAVPIRQMLGALECLNKLQGDHRLALVSIGRPEQQRRKMVAAGLDPARFDHIHIVDEGSKQGSFEKLAAAWGLCPGPDFQKVVVIGDRYATDIAPAQELGMRSIMIGSQPAKQEPDARIASLEELAPILARWSREKTWGPVIS